MPGRSYTGNAYRYGFNGQEGDMEFKDLGNSVDYGMRGYDPRLGKWYKTDPHYFYYPATTPYAFALNSPVMLKDNLGADVYFYDASFNLLAIFKTKAADIAYRIKKIEKPENIQTIEIDLDKELPNTDAIGFGVDYTGLMGGGFEGGFEMVMFTRGPQAFAPSLYGFGGIGFGLGGGLSGYVVIAKYKGNKQDITKNSWEGLSNSYAFGLHASGNYFWTNKGNEAELYPNMKSPVAWSGFRINTGLWGTKANIGITWAKTKELVQFSLERVKTPTEIQNNHIAKQPKIEIGDMDYEFQNPNPTTGTKTKGRISGTM